MNHPHEPQAAAMARTGELPDGEQLRECINSGQVSAAQVVAHAEAGEVTTGWPPGLLQDDSRQLSRALSRDPNARALAREVVAQAATEGDDYDNFLVLENDAFDKYWDRLDPEFKEGLLQIGPKIVAFFGWLQRSKLGDVAHQDAGELIAINTTDRALVRESVAYGWRTECLKAEAALSAERAEVARLRKALHDAATSLGTVNRLAGRDKYMESMLQVRGYAIARAEAAFDALNPTQGATNHD